MQVTEIQSEDMSSLHDDGQIAADEGTHLLISSGATSTKNTSTSSTQDNAFNILLSTTLSRFGSRSWEFVTPLLLLEWSPGSFAAPASLGLARTIFRTGVLPWLGRLADDWDRLNTVWIGTSMQAMGCLLSIGALVLFNSSTFSGKTYNADEDGNQSLLRLFSYVLVITAGVIEALGSQLASIAVKKEWVPIVFDEEVTSQPITEEEQGENNFTIFSFAKIPSPVTMSFMNTTMTNIDLLAGMFGPLLAGWILEILTSTDSSMQRGFVLIALLNVVSFIPEIYLLRKVYLSCPALQSRRRNIANSGGQSSKQLVSSSSINGDNVEDVSPWKLWMNHPSGLPLLTISLASLYMTALSSNGVVITSYLMTIGLSPKSLGIFRGLGALSGVVGISTFSFLRQKNDANNGDEQSKLVKSIERLRRLSLAFLLLEIGSLLVATFAFALRDEVPIASSWQIHLFLGAIVVSRAGLYAFDVGVLEIEQFIVDERYRNAVGSVEGAICSLCEMGMYVLSIALPKPEEFGWQVGVSTSAVSFGGVCFGLFLCLYHMHLHHHHYDGEDHHHDHSHGHDHHHYHRHTLQQERDLKEGYHIHLHRHGRLWR